jgi:hypothetical protein
VLPYAVSQVYLLAAAVHQLYLYGFERENSTQASDYKQG